MPRFRMTCVDRPSWARDPDVWLTDMKLADYQAIQARREELLRVVHEEVESYLNTAGLYCEGDEDGFPNRTRMTGAYYIGDESYAARVKPVRFEMSVQCRCLGMRIPSRVEAGDYLGLEVWLQCVPSKDWSFEVFRNTDSSVI